MPNGVRIRRVSDYLDTQLSRGLQNCTVLSGVRYGNHPWSSGKSSKGRVFDRVVLSGDRKFGIFARSQTRKGSAEQKVYSYNRDCELLNSKDFRAVIVLCGNGWTPELVNDLRGLGNTLLPEELPFALASFFGERDD